MVTKTAPIQLVIELKQYFWWLIDGLNVVYQYLVAVFQSVKRLVSNRRFPEGHQALQNALVPKYA